MLAFDAQNLEGPLGDRPQSAGMATALYATELRCVHLSTSGLPMPTSAFETTDKIRIKGGSDPA